MRNTGLVAVVAIVAAVVTMPNAGWAAIPQDVPLPYGFRIDCLRMYQGEGVYDPPPRFGIDRAQHWLYWATRAPYTPNLAVSTYDLDSSGMLDSWEVAIVGAVLCNPSHPYYASVEAAFQANVAALPLEGGELAFFDDYVNDFLAAHMLCSTTACDFWKDQWSMTGTYAPFTVGPDEVLSPGGDLDGDGYTNQEEYENVRAAGVLGTRTAFYEAVADSGSDGTIALPSTGMVARSLLATACVILGVSAIAGVLAVRRRRGKIAVEA